MENLNKEIEVVKRIVWALGGWGTLFAIAYLVAAYFYFIYLKKSIEKLAEETTEKSLKKFQNSLDETLAAKLKLIFRNEEIRNAISSNFAIRSIDTKIQIWMETYGLFFEYQMTWNFKSDELFNMLKVLDEKLGNNRKNIFINSVFLGGFLTAKLIRLNSSLREIIRKKSQLNQTPCLNPTGQQNLQAAFNKLNDTIPIILSEVEKWMNENIAVDHDSKMYNFTSEQQSIINEETKKTFDRLPND